MDIWELTENCLQWLHQCQFDAQDDESGARLDTYLASFDLWCDGIEANLHTVFESQPINAIIVKKVLILFHQFLWNYAKLLRDAQGTDDALRNVESAIKNLASPKQNELPVLVREFFPTHIHTVTDIDFDLSVMFRAVRYHLNKLQHVLQQSTNQALLSHASHNTPNEGTGEEMMIQSLKNATLVDLVGNRLFIPHHKLLEICNEQAVAKELARVFPKNGLNTNKRLTRSICYGQMQGPYITSKSCRKTFAILVLIRQVRLIELFLSHQFCDDDLPLHNTSDFHVLESSREGPKNELHLLEGFNQYEIINSFIDKQWLVLSPDLKKGKMRSAPFLQAREYTLNDLWAKHPHNIIISTGLRRHEFSRWICIQCHNIIRDLRAIYKQNNTPPADNSENVSRIHIEIKPDNILHLNGGSASLGSLKVSDLDYKKSQQLVSSMGQQPQFCNSAYRTYRAPENDINNIRSIGIGIETWALGCLFAEFLTWAIGGKEAVEIFKMERIYEDERLCSQFAEDNFFIKQSDDPKKVPERKKSVDEVC